MIHIKPFILGLLVDVLNGRQIYEGSGLGEVNFEYDKEAFN